VRSHGVAEVAISDLSSPASLDAASLKSRRSL
jgi:hypothetical protein